MLLAAPLLALACGYRMTGQGTRLGDKVKTISIPIFENDSKEPDIELTVSRAVVNRFVRDGRLSVTGNGADCTLTGTVKSLTLQPVSYDSLNRVSQYRALLTVKIHFEDRISHATRMDREIQVQWDYSVGASILTAEAAKRQAINEAGNYLGDRLIELILEGF